MSQAVQNKPDRPRSFEVRVLRQDAPGRPRYWQRHRVEYEPDMNVISVLQKIAQTATTIDGRRVAPVAWECNCLEEVCGSCTMVINGKVRQACSALVDRLLEERPQEIELRPMRKFPVVRDLMVDRERMFATLKRIMAWLPVDSYLDLGPGPRQSQDEQQLGYRYSKCMTCGCCLDACPQYVKVDVERAEGESVEERKARKEDLYNRSFMGAFAMAQVELFDANPVGRMTAWERLEALVAEGGIQICGNAQNCQKVCPKEVPLLTAIGHGGRAATLHVLRKLFDR